MGKTLYDKVFEKHVVREIRPGQYQLFIGLHLVHEVTSPQAFEMIRERKLKVMFPERTFATLDHIIPTDKVSRPYFDILSEDMASELEKNVREYGVRFFSPDKGEQGIVHIIGPEQGLTQPGMTICCGDSHTSTHGAFGALAFGIGTSQVRDLLATQTLAMNKLKVRKIEVNGKLKKGVFAKDVILHIINKLGANGGAGFAYEYSGDVFKNMSMDERMTVCNMSIEGSARCGYVNPDETTYNFIKGRPFAPKNWDAALAYWESIKSDPDAEYADIVKIDASEIEPMVTWGVGLDQSVNVNQRIPADAIEARMNPDNYTDAIKYMKWKPGQDIKEVKIDVAFLGSCTNARLSDFELVANELKKSGAKVADGIKAIVVPGSQAVRKDMIAKGLDKIFVAAGFEFREPGCSMCLAMNPDKLQGDQVCASSSNRNYKGRQGSPTGRTMVMSPLMVAAAAVKGKISDAREVFSL